MYLGFLFVTKMPLCVRQLFFFLLQRNLKVMINMGLSAKKEKDDRFQLIKKEVIDMVKINAPTLESKVRVAQPCCGVVFKV